MPQLPYSGPISLGDIQTTFVGGSNPISMSEYYAGGGYVPSGTVGYPGGVSTPIPSSGVISMANFYGAKNSVTVEVAVIAGGGGGGDSIGWEGGGGGGGGGYVRFTAYNVSGSRNVVVGLGGAFQTNGQNSSFGDAVGAVVAYGGGAGGYNNATSTAGASGGSGGGGTGTYGSVGGGAGTAGQGYAGGSGPGDSAGGSGGGAGGAGTAGAYYSTPATPSAAGVSLTVAGQTFVLGKGGEGGGFNRYGTGQKGAAGPWPGGGGGGNASVGTNDFAGKGGAVLVWYPGSIVKASGGTIYNSGGQVLHVFTSNGTFALL